MKIGEYKDFSYKGNSLSTKEFSIDRISENEYSVSVINCGSWLEYKKTKEEIPEFLRGYLIPEEKIKEIIKEIGE